MCSLQDGGRGSLSGSNAFKENFTAFVENQRKYFSKTNRAKNSDAIALYFCKLEEHTEVLESKYHPDKSAFASVE